MIEALYVQKYNTYPVVSWYAPTTLREYLEK